MQTQWEFNGKLIFKAGRYDVFKYPQFTLSIYIYDLKKITNKPRNIPRFI